MNKDRDRPSTSKSYKTAFEKDEKTLREEALKAIPEENKLREDAYKIAVKSASTKEYVYPYIPISTIWIAPIERKYSHLSSEEVMNFYLKNFTDPFIFPKDFLYYQEILTSTGSVQFDSTTRSGGEWAFSKAFIHRVITPEQWEGDLYRTKEIQPESRNPHKKPRALRSEVDPRPEEVPVPGLCIRYVNASLQRGNLDEIEILEKRIAHLRKEGWTDDPTLKYALCLDVKTEGFDMMSGAQNVILMYRICYKAMNTVVPDMKKISNQDPNTTTLFITDIAKSNTVVPKTISWDQVKLPDKWILEEGTRPVKQENRKLNEIIEYQDGTVEIKFSKERIVRLITDPKEEIPKRNSTSSIPLSRIDTEQVILKNTLDGVSQPEYKVEIPSSSGTRVKSPTPSDMGYEDDRSVFGINTITLDNNLEFPLEGK
ncbi:UNVERIFIED_CONTAM: hypothetical protein Scaly_3040400 [Sesamum calycinum]|uniref:Uncharacterized protein n=1 Tax=Sesamum calycinum TaxID=2727403 RepID=A0AAW2K5J8_9LAMI